MEIELDVQSHKINDSDAMQRTQYFSEGPPRRCRMQKQNLAETNIFLSYPGKNDFCCKAQAYPGQHKVPYQYKDVNFN